MEFDHKKCDYYDKNGNCISYEPTCTFGKKCCCFECPDPCGEKECRELSEVVNQNE